MVYMENEKNENPIPLWTEQRMQKWNAISYEQIKLTQTSNK